jgi:hypothetical protein
MSLTYVTAFLKIYEVDDDTPVIGRTLATRIEWARPLLNSTLPLVVFISPCYLSTVQAICGGRPQIQFCPIELKETETWALLAPFKDKIPTFRNQEKDTFEFLALMNAKAEFVASVAKRNPYDTSQFAWVDFSIFHVLQNAPVSQRRLEALCSSELTPEHPLVIPGCWVKQTHIPCNAIHWRFCGGFYMGLRDAVLQFYELHKTYLPIAFDGCAWEVNYWAHIEQKEPTFRISWFKAGHEDTILMVPNEMFAKLPEGPVLWLTKLANRTGAYVYTALDGYHPTSSSFVEFQGTEFLNVRHVNYTLTPQSQYIIQDPRGRLRTQNYLLRLKGVDSVESSSFLQVETTCPTFCEEIQGLEDIRLYSFGNQLKFIATQRQWSPSRQNRMAIGVLDCSENVFRDIQIVEPPSPTNCEKNWIPIEKDGQECFIYQWYPFQIGHLEGNRLQILQTVETNRLFQKVRGSTIFHRVEEGLLGLVHWSEEGAPRHYYHRLVMLDSATLVPVSVSDPFVFGRIGIEFCIGMAVRGPDLQFWYSQHDRDPVWLTVPRAALPMRPV